MLHSRCIWLVRRGRPLLGLLPLSVLVVASLTGVAIAAEAVLTRQSREAYTIVSPALSRAQAKRNRSVSVFDARRASAVATSPIVMPEGAPTQKFLEKRPADCLLAEMADTLRCQ